MTLSNLKSAEIPNLDEVTTQEVITSEILTLQHSYSEHTEAFWSDLETEIWRQLRLNQERENFVTTESLTIILVAKIYEKRIASKIESINQIKQAATKINALAEKAIRTNTMSEEEVSRFNEYYRILGSKNKLNLLSENASYVHQQLVQYRRA